MKSSGPLNGITARNNVTMLQSTVLDADLDRSGRLETSPAVQIAKTTRAMAGEISDSGLEQLESVTGKLGKLLENLEPVMTVMDEASKVHSLLYLVSIYGLLIPPLCRFIPTLRPPGLLSHRSIKSVYHTDITPLLSSNYCNQLRGVGVSKESSDGQRYCGPRRGHGRHPLIR